MDVWAEVLQNQTDYRNAQLDLQRDSLSNQMKIAEGGWAVQKYGIKTQLKIAKMNLDFQYEQMERVAIPALELDKWYKEQQIKLAKKAHELAQANLGLEYMKFASTLRGPENYYQFADFIDNAQGNRDVPLFLRELQENARGADFGQPGQVLNPITADDLRGMLTGDQRVAAQSGGYSDSATLSTWEDIFRAGAHRLAPGSLEGLGEMEQGLMKSAADKLGVDLPAWLRGYTASRLGNASPLLA